MTPIIYTAAAILARSGVGIDFVVTWAKNALGTEKSIPTPLHGSR